MAARSRSSASSRPGLSFNHAIVYSLNVDRALTFYRDHLGFRVLERVDHRGRPVYARLRSARGDGTLALHAAEPGARSVLSPGVRLYFEVKDLKSFCRRLRASGVRFSQPPKVMPWGWTHAYLNDPDGHELSLYWAGRKRFLPSKMAR